VILFQKDFKIGFLPGELGVRWEKWVERTLPKIKALKDMGAKIV